MQRWNGSYRQKAQQAPQNYSRIGKNPQGCLLSQRRGPFLRRYTDDGRLKIDNYRAECSIKPFVIGRKFPIRRRGLRQAQQLSASSKQQRKQSWTVCVSAFYFHQSIQQPQIIEKYSGFLVILRSKIVDSLNDCLCDCLWRVSFFASSFLNLIVAVLKSPLLEPFLSIIA